MKQTIMQQSDVWPLMGIRGAEEFPGARRSSEKSGFTVDGGFSTHPTTLERIRNIKK